MVTVAEIAAIVWSIAAIEHRRTKVPLCAGLRSRLRQEMETGTTKLVPWMKWELPRSGAPACARLNDKGAPAESLAAGRFLALKSWILYNRSSRNTIVTNSLYTTYYLPLITNPS